jgi:hypothetical protein
VKLDSRLRGDDVEGVDGVDGVVAVHVAPGKRLCRRDGCRSQVRAGAGRDAVVERDSTGRWRMRITEAAINIRFGQVKAEVASGG